MTCSPSSRLLSGRVIRDRMHLGLLHNALYRAPWSAWLPQLFDDQIRSPRGLVPVPVISLPCGPAAHDSAAMRSRNHRWADDIKFRSALAPQFQRQPRVREVFYVDKIWPLVLLIGYLYRHSGLYNASKRGEFFHTIRISSIHTDIVVIGIGIWPT